MELSYSKVPYLVVSIEVWYKGEVRLSTGGIHSTFASVGSLITSLSVTTTAGVKTIDFTGGDASVNSVVKSYNTNAPAAYNKSGYSLYDSDDVKYWKIALPLETIQD